MEQWLTDLIAEVDADLARLGSDPAEVAYSTKRRMAILRRWPDTAVRAAEQDKRRGDDTEALRYDDEVRQIKAAIPKPNPDLDGEKEAQLQVGRDLRDGVLNRLTMLQLRAHIAGDAAKVAAIGTAITDLSAITTATAVLAASGADETRTAFMSRYTEIGAALYAASPEAYVEFRSLDT